MRVLYSFPHRIGAGRICHTAYQQVCGIAAAGAEVTLMAGSTARPLPASVAVHTTLSKGKWRLPVRWLGRTRACQWHDQRVAAWLEANGSQVDLVHAWPLGALRTLEVAKRKGIPSVLERPNAHTAFAYQVVAEEGRKVGVELPKGHDHESNQSSLRREEDEYREASFLLCPSDFVKGTFEERGHASESLLRHRYGYDPTRFYPAEPLLDAHAPFAWIYAGVAEPRKGLHHALDAWFESGASEAGTFRICGEFVPGYAEKLGSRLDHPSVEVLGHRQDLPDLFRRSHAFVLSSVEEGSALVTYEARAAGCVLMVSDASGAPCRHDVDALVHPAGDTVALTRQLGELLADRDRLQRLRAASIPSATQLTWEKAGEVLCGCYEQAVLARGPDRAEPACALTG